MSLKWSLAFALALNLVVVAAKYDYFKDKVDYCEHEIDTKSSLCKTCCNSFGRKIVKEAEVCKCHPTQRAHLWQVELAKSKMYNLRLKEAI